MGFTWENDLHLFYRRAKASETAFGDANVSSRAHRLDGYRFWQRICEERVNYIH